MVILQNTPKLYTQVEVDEMLCKQYAIAFEAGRQAEREDQAKAIQQCGQCGRDLANEIRARSTK